VPKTNLRSRKRQFVQDAIFDAAIEIFSAKGFDETTVDDVARAAGVSRASFFRYFTSKDDLLAQNVTQHGSALTEAIKACPPSFTPIQTMHEIVLSVARHRVAHPRTRQVIEISLRSSSAMQAHVSRMIEVERSVAIAFAERIGGLSKDDLEPRLLAAMTVSTMNVAIMSWYRGNHQDLSAAVEQVFSRLTQLVSETDKLDATRIKGVRPKLFPE
jgi:TetR/AcrR family transcriptional regulator, regulator of mycofactocin system